MLEDMGITADYLCTLTAEVDAPVTLARHGGMARRMIPIRGGTVTGRLEGEILPGGADWQFAYESGLADLEARYCLRLSGGADVEVQSSGIRSGDPAVLEKLYSGAEVPPEDYYFRTAIKFRTSAEDYLWLTRSLCVGIAGRDAGKVVIRLFEIR